MLRTAFVFALALTIGSVGAISQVSSASTTGGASKSPVTVRVDPAKITGRLSERYLGVALDWQKVDDGVWPTDIGELSSPVLRRLMSELAPSVLRIGGTDANGAWFCATDSDCSPPPSYVDAFTDDDKEVKIFTGSDVEALLDFAQAVDANIIFTLNLGPGPRDATTGAWAGDNVRELLEFVATLEHRDRFTTWEAGNEVNIIFNEYAMPVPLTPDIYAEDLATLRALIDETLPDTELIGPAAFFLPLDRAGDLKFTKRTLKAVNEGVLDGVSWHLYATQSPRCSTAVSPYPASLETLFDPEQIALNQGFARQVAASAGDLPVINSESASVQCGGQFGISDTMLDALWWTDWIGLMAEEGTGTIVRQTLVGREYAIVDQHTLVPHPAFLVSVLQRRHADRAHLGTAVKGDDVHVHAYCTSGRDDAVTVAVSNPTTSDHDVAVEVKGRTVKTAQQWTVVADLEATAATINALPAGADGSIPDEPGEPVDVKGGVAHASVPANGVAFVVADLKGTAASCTDGASKGRNEP
jgi:hypothetical protein